jgi:hypothetical protein
MFKDYVYLLLFTYNKNIKDVPEIIIDGISKNYWATKNLANTFIGKNIQIPDKILDKLNIKGGDFFSDLATKSLILMHNDKEIPELFNYYISKDSAVSALYYSFLKSQNKEIPEIIKKAIKNKDENITEALDREKLIYMAVKETPVAIDLLTQLAYAEKDIPDLLSRVVAERSGASICARIASYIIAYSERDVPEALLEKISTNKKIANDIAFIYKNNRKEIPDIIKNVLSKKNREFYEDDIWGFGAAANTVNEALDKDKLLDVISKDEEAYIQTLRHYFLDKNELPPENLIDIASKDVAAAVIFAEYCLEYKKEIRPDIIEKIAEYPRGAYTIAALMRMEERDVPEILIDSIKSDPLSLKHYQEILQRDGIGRPNVLNLPNDIKVYLKI